MANKDYLDELDALLDNPNAGDSDEDFLSQSALEGQTLGSASPSVKEQANVTWAKIIEQASDSLQVSAQTVQEAVQKNIDLAKTQQESIRELSDATSGWRHAARQAVEEVTSAKKHVLMLTIISGVIAVIGFSTTIGVMLQSRAGLADMSNAVLENVDDHQKLISRTLTLKMDELAATIERMETQLNQIDKSRMAAGHVALGQTESEVEVTAQAQSEEPVASDLKLTPLLTQLQQNINQLQVNLATFEQKWSQSDASLQQQLAQLPGLLEKLKPATTASAPHAQPAAKNVPLVVKVDNKDMLNQLMLLRQELKDLRQLQRAMRDQIHQLQQKSLENAPYQYRSPDLEGYPR